MSDPAIVLPIVGPMCQAQGCEQPATVVRVRFTGPAPKDYEQRAYCALHDPEAPSAMRDRNEEARPHLDRTRSVPIEAVELAAKREALYVEMYRLIEAVALRRSISEADADYAHQLYLRAQQLPPFAKRKAGEP
jgi:hypothetical protein